MISPYAVVETDHVGLSAIIHEFSVIRAGAVVGDHVVIHPNVVIESGVVIEEGVEVFPGAFLGKEPKGAGATARPVHFERRVRIGSGSSIGPNAVVFYDVEIGSNTLLGDGASVREQSRIGSECIISRYVTINYNTTIGDGTKIMDLTHVTGNCVIGNDVFISVNVGMVNDNAIGRLEFDEARVQGPTIEDGAAIGAGATLLPAVVIGRGAIVGAGSVVTKDVEARTLVIGAPARRVRSLDPGDGHAE